MSKLLSEEDMLMAVATAQGVLEKAATQILKGDKEDGMRAMKWTMKHRKLYLKFRDALEGRGFDDDVFRKADSLAGENPC